MGLQDRIIRMADTNARASCYGIISIVSICCSSSSCSNVVVMVVACTLVQTHSSPSLDPARMVSMQNLIKKQIRSWIMRSLSLAPCTTQGLLQVLNLTTYICYT